MIKLIIYLFVAFGSEKLFYNYIRKLDKKERKLLQKWEDEYIDNEIDKIKANKLNYKTTKRKKVDVDVEDIIYSNTDSENNS